MPYIAYVAPSGPPSGPYTVYSLRRAVTGYSGNAFQLRRSSDNALLDIGFQTDGWFDTAAALAHVGGGDGYIECWYDQSGNGNNLATSNGTAKLIASGVIYTRATKYMVNWNSAPFYQSAAGSLADTTAFAAIAYNSGAASSRTLISGNGNNNIQLRMTSAQALELLLENGASVVSRPGVTTDIHWLYMSGGAAPSTQTVGVDGNFTSVAASPAFIAGWRAYGAKADLQTEKWDDGYGEAWHYARALTNAERNALLSWMASWWGIGASQTLSPGTGHVTITGHAPTVSGPISYIVGEGNVSKILGEGGSSKIIGEGS